jgi:hypothetical protein
MALGVGMFFLFSQEPSSTSFTVEPAGDATTEPLGTVVRPNITVSKSFVLLGDRGPVYWLFTQARHSEVSPVTIDYALSLINPQTGDTTKTITLLKGGEEYKRAYETTNIVYLGGLVYEVDEKNAKVTARDMYSGEVVVDNDQLIKRFPALGAGIGKLRLFNGWFEIVTTQGEKYWYAPSSNKFGSDTEKLEVNGDYNDKKGWLYMRVSRKNLR